MSLWIGVYSVEWRVRGCSLQHWAMTVLITAMLHHHWLWKQHWCSQCNLRLCLCVYVLCVFLYVCICCVFVCVLSCLIIIIIVVIFIICSGLPEDWNTVRIEAIAAFILNDQTPIRIRYLAAVCSVMMRLWTLTLLSTIVFGGFSVCLFVCLSVFLFFCLSVCPCFELSGIDEACWIHALRWQLHHHPL